MFEIRRQSVSSHGIHRVQRDKLEGFAAVVKCFSLISYSDDEELAPSSKS
jgi:hypothetical protein